ncbi:Rieske (2Fe-2S) protein [Streptomyces hoynatensis]|uniref:Rieske (2Fe-2S) protein n=1 Tax=Streptomyces hoynatensis TaxID=1141874 RepID=A0A3A9YTD2_9ACTN|nr:Rieske (2Fe-2S) protein [Streptomyces hoynatensis]
MRLRRGPTPWERQRPTWREAAPAAIGAALARAQARPAGNWYVVGASRELRPDGPLGRTVAGTELVLWRDARGRPLAGPGACPHLGAPLRRAAVRDGRLLCHWHGLALDGRRFAGWAPWPAHDDGLLLWVRLDRVGAEPPTERPPCPPRPAGGVAAVYAGRGRCEPEDVLANRLDPWHGAWLHPYSFTDLSVVQDPGEEADPAGGPGCGEFPVEFAVDVSFRLAGPAVVPVRAEFAAPGPRTVVMRIVEGTGAGSVVETHATPLTPAGAATPVTLVTEAVVAVSDWRGFAAVRAAAPVLRPLLRAASGRLWRDDLAYAERRWTLRRAGRLPGGAGRRPGGPGGAEAQPPVT